MTSSMVSPPVVIRGIYQITLLVYLLPHPYTVLQY